MENTTSRQRIVAIVAFAAPILWQMYAVVSAFRQAPALKKLLSGLGDEIPLVTQYFYALYPFWWLAPVIFAGLSLDVLRRHDPPLVYFSSVLVASVISSLVLHAWLYEAFFAPLFSVLEKIG
jgi:hypothetical protein